MAEQQTASVYIQAECSEKIPPKAWVILSCAWVFYLYEYILRVSPTVITNQ